MKLIATAVPTETLLRMFHDISPIPGSWVKEVCGSDINIVRRAECDEQGCEWKECVFIHTTTQTTSVSCLDADDHGLDQLFARVRKNVGASLTGYHEVHVIAHDGVLGICTL